MVGIITTINKKLAFPIILVLILTLLSISPVSTSLYENITNDSHQNRQDILTANTITDNITNSSLNNTLTLNITNQSINKTANLTKPNETNNTIKIDTSKHTNNKQGFEKDINKTTKVVDNKKNEKKPEYPIILGSQSLSDCQELNTSNTTYNLTANIFSNNETCFNITAVNVTLDCEGFTVEGNLSVNTSYGVFALGVDNVSVRNCVFKGWRVGVVFENLENGLVFNSSFNHTRRAGVAFLNVSYSNISYSNFSNIYQDDFSGGSDVDRCNISFYGSYADMGVLVDNGSSNYVGYNTFVGNDTGSGIDFHDGTETATRFCWSVNNTVEHNVILGMDVFGTEFYNSSSNRFLYNFENGTNLTGARNTNDGVKILANSSYNNVSHNEFHGNEEWGIFVAGPYTLVWNNTVTNNGVVGIRLLSASGSPSYNNTVVGNRINETDAEGIRIETNSNNNVSQNIIHTSGSSGYGIRLDGSNNNTIANTNITTSGSSGRGIYLHSSSNNNAITNTNIATSGDYGYGIYLYYSNNNNVITNTNITTSGSYGYGIYLYYYSNNDTITNTNIATSGSYGYGIYLYYSNNNNTITNTNITTSGNYGYGLYIFSSSNNNITNTRINSTKAYAIYVEGSTNPEYYNHTIDTSNTEQGKPIYYLYNQQDSVVLENTNNVGELFITYSNNVTVRNVTLDKDGIILALTNNSKIENLTLNISKDNVYGVWIRDASNNNTISNTNITTSGSYGYGIYLNSSNNNAITNTNITTSGKEGGHGYGVYFYSSNNQNIVDSIINAQNSYDIYIFSNCPINNFTNTSFNESDVYFDAAGSSKIFVKWYLDVNVSNSSGGPVANATVTAWDKNGNLSFSVNSSSNGFIPRQTLVEYWQNSSGKFFYTNYTLNTSKQGFSPDSRELNLTNSYQEDVALLKNSELTCCGVLNLSNTTYVLQNSVFSSAGVCFNITAVNVTLDCEGFTVEGNLSVNTSYGVFALGVDNVSVRNCVFKGWRVGVVFENLENGLVFNSSFNHTRRAGVAFLNVSYSNVSYNNFTNIYQDDFVGGGDLERCNISDYGYASDMGVLVDNGSSNYVGYNSFVGNDTGSGLSFHDGTETATRFCWSVNNTVEHNVILGMDVFGTEFYNSSSNRFLYNFENGTNLTGARNTQDGVKIFANSSNNNVSHNEFHGNFEWGIFSIGRNTFIWNNTISNTGYVGIKLLSSSSSPGGNNTVVNNKIVEQDAVGIRIQADSANNSNNLVMNNNITTYAYSGYGIELRYVWENNITNNTINSLNSYAVYVVPNYNPQYYNNSVDTSNTKQGEPIYYYFNSQDFVISNLENVSELYIAYSNNITLRNVTLNKDGLILALTNNSTIEDLYINVSNIGLQFSDNSTNNNLLNSTIFTSGDNHPGIYFYNSPNINNITSTTITTTGNSSHGIEFSGGTNNNFSDCVINATNAVDIFVSGSNQINYFINTTFNKTDVYFELAPSSKIFVKWYLDVNVSNSSGSPVANATVTAWDRDGSLTFSVNSSSNGFIPRQTLIEYWQDSSAKFFYTNYTLNTSKQGFRPDSRELNLTNSYQEDVMLQENHPPNVSLNYPGNNVFINKDHVLLNATVFDDDLDNLTVWFYGDNALLNTSYNVTNNTIVLHNWTSITDGFHNWSVIANDGFINSSVEHYYFTIDTLKPDIGFSDPTTQSGNYSSNYITVNVSATDENLNLIVIYLYNSTSLINTTNSSTSPLLVNYTNLPNDVYYFNATAFDAANNSNTTETITVNLDTTPPNIGFVNQTTTTGNHSQLWIAANVTATDPLFDHLIVFLYNSTTLVNSSNSSSSTFFVNFTNLQEGVYYLNATAFDAVNNSNSTETRTINLDVTVPEVYDLKPSNGSSFNVSAAIEVACNVSDNVGVGVVIANITYPNASFQELILSHVLGDKYNSSFTIPNITGQYNISFIANDSANNINNSGLTSFIGVDNQPPIISNLTPAKGSNLSILTTIEIAVNVTDNIGVSVVSANITYPNGSIVGLNLFNTTDNWFNTSFTIPASVGLYNVSFTALDIFNNSGFNYSYFFANACGLVVNSSVTLYNDMHCNGNGLIINASNLSSSNVTSIVLDCNNHSIIGSGNSSGVIVLNSVSNDSTINVSLTYCNISNFSISVNASKSNVFVVDSFINNVSGFNSTTTLVNTSWSNYRLNNSYLFVAWHLFVGVKHSSTYLSNATISLNNSLGVINYYNTNSSGWAHIFANQLRINSSETLNLNNHSITVSKSGYHSSTSTHNISNNTVVIFDISPITTPSTSPGRRGGGGFSGVIVVDWLGIDCYANTTNDCIETAENQSLTNFSVVKVVIKASNSSIKGFVKRLNDSLLEDLVNNFGLDTARVFKGFHINLSSDNDVTSIELFFDIGSWISGINNYNSLLLVTDMGNYSLSFAKGFYKTVIPLNKASIDVYGIVYAAKKQAKTNITKVSIKPREESEQQNNSLGLVSGQSVKSLASNTNKPIFKWLMRIIIVIVLIALILFGFYAYKVSMPKPYITDLLLKGFKEIKLGKYKKARKTYRQVVKLYNNLRPDEQKKQHNRVVKLYKLLKDLEK